MSKKQKRSSRKKMATRSFNRQSLKIFKAADDARQGQMMRFLGIFG